MKIRGAQRHRSSVIEAVESSASRREAAECVLTCKFDSHASTRSSVVEGFFAKLTRRRLKRGVFRSLDDLKAAIDRFVAETNVDPKSFVWTAKPTRILAAIKRVK